MSGDFWGCFQAPNCGLFPRHRRATKTRFFVHARILHGSSRHAGRKGKKSFKIIVQICALSCM
ncbi:hypothetical protein FQF29_03860 [Escherichia coli]|nr:hypothetical protein AM464_03030 [Escherichia coli]EEW1557642.1 hypothetical protein [Escherichia coli]EFB6606341.1 hypothetical protein [Escherichia coli]MGT34966.1 hypothetical protein [Escherichia coli]MHT29972.1 hypothetical protein [Escherichia coli]